MTDRSLVKFRHCDFLTSSITISSIQLALLGGDMLDSGHIVWKASECVDIIRFY